MTYTMKKRVLAALLTALMLLTLTGAHAPASAETASTPTGSAIQVKDVDELVAAIGPNVTVELAAGDYDLAAATSYGKETNNPYCCWETSSDQGFQLTVSGADGLTLRGAGMDETTLLAQDQYASVLSFSNCRELTIADLTAGHAPQPGFCSGAVLYLRNCSKATVAGCGLFGCGTVGVWAANCSDLDVGTSRIYECSESAVYADSCRNVTVHDCEIDHNGWKGDYGASSLFQANNGDGFTVSACRVHDNTAELLLQSAHTRGASFLLNRVEYNLLHYVFALYDVPATVDGCLFHENYMDSWYPWGYGERTLTAQDGAGNALSEEALSAMIHRPIQQAGYVDTGLKEPTEVPVGGKITVTTVDEFLDAIGPDRTIVLDGELFSLADLAAYGTGEGQYYRWEPCYDGPQLVIRYVSNLTIRAAEGKQVAFTAMPRYADVLCFETCDHVSLAGLTMGHTEGSSECCGAVLHFEGCSEVTVDSCRLYGCGTLGVDASSVRDLKVTDCEIYDCSIGGAVLYDVSGAAFQGCRVHDVPSPMLCLYDCSEVTWNGKALFDNHYDVTPAGEPVSVDLW